MNEQLSQAELKSVLSYNTETGEFLWKKTGKGKRPNLAVGTYNRMGYIIITLNYQRYMAHRLAWLYVHGYFPQELDHIDRNPGNNAIVNLRVATHPQNIVNSKTRTDNTSGCPGVCWDRQKLKWKVQISFSGAKRIQKHFRDFDEAVEFYKQTARDLFKEFAPIELTESSDRT